MKSHYITPLSTVLRFVEETRVCQASLNNLSLTESSDISADYGWITGIGNDL